MMRSATLIAAGILLLSACGSGDTSDDDATGDTSPPPLSESTSTAAPTTSTAPTDGDATLADYLPMFGPEDPEEAEAFWRDQERQAQEYTRECMAEEGFEYIPWVPSEEGFYGWEEDEEERVKTQGFGMAWWFLEGEALMEEEEAQWEEDPDPNWELMEAMSDAEREAYEWALFGEQPDMELDWESAETEEEMMALEEEAQRLWEEREWIGCMEMGWNQAQGGGGEDLWMSFEEEFGDWWSEIDERIQADPRIIELETSWVTCMAEAGYEFRDMDEMHMSLQEEFDRLVTWPGDEGAGVTDAPPEVEPIEQEDGSVIFVDPEGNEYTEDQMEEFWRPRYDEAELRAFMEKEIAVATADYYCSEGRWETYGEIYDEYQNQWVAEHKAELDAWKAGLEAGE